MAVVFLQQTDLEILRVMSLVLRLEGYDVLTSHGFPDDLAGKIASSNADLVLLDHALDGRDCLAVLRSIRGAGLELPVLVSGCLTNVPAFCKKHGFDGCLEMPFDLGVFYDTIVDALRTKKPF